MDKLITNRMLTGLSSGRLRSLGWVMIERGASSAEVCSVIKRWEKLNGTEYGEEN